MWIFSDFLYLLQTLKTITICECPLITLFTSNNTNHKQYTNILSFPLFTSNNINHTQYVNVPWFPLFTSNTINPIQYVNILWFPLFTSNTINHTQYVNILWFLLFTSNTINHTQFVNIFWFPLFTSNIYRNNKTNYSVTAPQFCQETGHLHSTDWNVKNSWNFKANHYFSAKHNHVSLFNIQCMFRSKRPPSDHHYNTFKLWYITVQNVLVIWYLILLTEILQYKIYKNHIKIGRFVMSWPVIVSNLCK